MKYTKEDIKKIIQSILEDIDNLNEMGYSNWEAYQKAETLLWDRLNDLHNNAIGLVGKYISFGIADGRANYIIVKENKANVVVQHLYIGDGYQSPAVYNNRVPKGLAEQYARFNDATNKIFG